MRSEAEAFHCLSYMPSKLPNEVWLRCFSRFHRVTCSTEKSICGRHISRRDRVDSTLLIDDGGSDQQTWKNYAATVNQLKINEFRKKHRIEAALEKDGRLDLGSSAIFLPHMHSTELPVIVAIHTCHECCHWLIGASGLHLIVCSLPLSTASAFKLISGSFRWPSSLTFK